MYGGIELAQIRDNKDLGFDDRLDAYVDASLLSPAVVPRHACSNLATTPLIDSLKLVLSTQVWNTRQLLLRARTLRAGET